MKYVRWLWRICVWTIEPRLFWLCILVVAAVVGVTALVPKSLADTLRFAGLVLQLLGIGAVIYELGGRSRLFNQLSVAKYIRDWGDRFPKLNPIPIVLSASGSAQGNSSASGRLSVWSPDTTSESIEARLAALVKNVETLRQEAAEDRLSSTTSISNLNEKVRVERLERIGDLHTLDKKVVELGAGSLDIELLGIVWLVLGIILATIPVELIGMVAALGGAWD